MSFKRIKSDPQQVFLAVIYDEQYPVDSGMCWALALVDAVDENEAAVKLAHYGGEILYGKDCELLRLPKAFVAPLKGIPRGIPIGEPNPLAAEMNAVLGDWLAMTIKARRARNTTQRVAVAPVDGGVVIAELTEEETAQMLKNEQVNQKPKTVH
jgi:hypothetical protein